MRIFIWGTGKIAQYIYDIFDMENSFTILGFIDNAEEKWGGYFKDYCIYSPEILTQKEYDQIYILCMAEDDISTQIEKMGISLDKVTKYSQMSIFGLALRTVNAAYLTGDYYTQIEQCNIPDTIRMVEYGKNKCDKFIINDYRETREDCSEKYNLPVEKIEDIGFILKHQYFQRYCRDGKNLSEEEKKCIRKMILSAGNTIFFYENRNEYEPMTVYFDERKGLKYVNFFGKKLYLSRKTDTWFDYAGIEKVSNLWFEQDEESPHKYFKDCDVRGTVVDCGACEGNFSLYHIDQIEKLFLVECDKDWVEALRATFEPYKEKVVICNKFLGDRCDKEHVTLNELLDGVKPDYIKMDIEGDEVEALHGADILLKNNGKCKWNICVYHKQNHAHVIRAIFERHGIRTEFSDGFINFIYDRDILNDFGLRKCLLCTK